jgi:hypothetical protein
MVPGCTLHRLAAHICSAHSLERVVDPAIADLQKEYATADARHASRRVWVLLTGYFAILKVIALCALAAPSTNEERRAVARTLAWSVTMVVAIVVLLILPPLSRSAAMRRWDSAITLIPQAAGLAIPLGVAFGIAFGLCARPAMSIAKMMLVCAFAASVLSFGVLAWAVPAGNQAFREITFRELRAKGYQGPDTVGLKGYSEMTLSELRSQEAYFSVEGEPRRARRFAFAFHFRFALAAATLALASVMLAAPVGHRGFRGFLALAACFVYWVLMMVGEMGSRRGYLPQPVAAWLPNVVLTAAAMFIAAARSCRGGVPSRAMR